MEIGSESGIARQQMYSRADSEEEAWMDEEKREEDKNGFGFDLTLFFCGGVAGWFVVAVVVKRVPAKKPEKIGERKVLQIIYGIFLGIMKQSSREHRVVYGMDGVPRVSTK